MGYPAVGTVGPFDGQAQIDLLPRNLSARTERRRMCAGSVEALVQC